MATLGQGPVVEARIAEIAAKIRKWEWQRGKSVPTTAKKWNVSEDYVRELAAEAKRRVYAEVTDPSAVLGDVATAMAAMVDEGMSHTGKGKVQMRRLAVDAGKALAQIVGAMAPQRHEINVGEPTPEKAAELVRARFGRVTPKVESAPAAGDAERSTPKE